MLPSTVRRRHQESGWMLLPKSYIYLGAIFCFFFGSLLGNGWQKMKLETSSTGSFAQRNNPTNRATVLVTGGLGFIGSHVVEDLIEQKFHVIIFDDMSNGRNFNKQSSAILLRDITVVDDFSYITHKIDYVVHLAAAISVSESVSMPEKYERINVDGSKKVLDWAKNNGVKRVVAASSAACYGVPKPENLPLQESTANGGICPYSQTKFKMEKLMQEYSSTYNLPTTALRFFNVYGPRQDPKSDYSGVISWFMDQAKENGKIKITGTGNQYRDFVFVKDVAKAVRIALLDNNPKFEAYNVCTGVKTTVTSLAKEIVKVFTSKAQIIYADPRPGDVLESVCSVEKSSKILKFKASYSLEEGLKATHDWFKAF